MAGRLHVVIVKESEDGEEIATEVLGEIECEDYVLVCWNNANESGNRREGISERSWKPPAR